MLSTGHANFVKDGLAFCDTRPQPEHIFSCSREGISQLQVILCHLPYLPPAKPPANCRMLIVVLHARNVHRQAFVEICVLAEIDVACDAFQLLVVLLEHDTKDRCRHDDDNAQRQVNTPC